MLEDSTTRQEAGDGSPPARPPNTTALLGLAYQALGKQIVDGVREAGFPQRPAHSAVMAHIDLDGGTRLSTLAARANITPQAVGELVDDLERLGYVARAQDPDDRRAKRVVLTDRGFASVSAAVETIRRLEEELARVLGAERLATLHESLTEISNTFGET
jgi:DNA-binding MarR family transcriptional regulator